MMNPAALLLLLRVRGIIISATVGSLTVGRRWFDALSQVLHSLPPLHSKSLPEDAGAALDL